MASIHDLKGFPMVFAYTEPMLNNQIAHREEEMFPSTFKFSQPEEEWDKSEGQEEPDWHFEINEFEAPRLSFNVPQLSNGAKLDIKIVDGTFKYFYMSRRGSYWKEILLAGQTLSIVTPVKQRRRDDYTDANLSIEAIYADLSSVEEAKILFDERSEVRIGGIPIETAVEGIIKKGLRSWVEEYEETHNGRPPMLFGGVKVPKVLDADYRLRPTGCTYSVTQ